VQTIHKDPAPSEPYFNTGHSSKSPSPHDNSITTDKGFPNTLNYRPRAPLRIKIIGREWQKLLFLRVQTFNVQGLLACVARDRIVFSASNHDDVCSCFLQRFLFYRCKLFNEELTIRVNIDSIPSSPLSYLPSRYLYHTPIERIQVPISRSYSQGFGTTENLTYRARGLLDSETSIISHHNFEREKSSYSSDSIRTDCSQNFLEPLLYESTNGILTSRKRIVPSVVLVSRVGGERIHIPYARQMREVVLTGLEGRMSR